MQDALLEKDDTQRAVSSEMTRQYKTMQTDMILRTHTLERELQLTRNELGSFLPYQHINCLEDLVTCYVLAAVIPFVRMTLNDIQIKQRQS